MFKTIKTFLASALVTFGLVAGSAYAAIPATVTTAIDEAQADGSALGYSLMVMAIVVGLIFWLKSRGSR